ncbi:MAG: hypothetical protein JNM81_07730 [Rhodospirillaceae bacterium]|nr:hypothetical protein [Rhodospirillaceae bacterium]
MVTFTSELNQTFIAHWRSLCTASSISVAEDYLDRIEPRIAPYILIYDLLADDLHVRFQGDEAGKRVGINLTGQSWFSINNYMQKELVLDNCRDCVAYSCGVWGESIYITASGREITLENIMVPLAAKDRRPPRLVNISALMDKIKDEDGKNSRVVPRRMTWLDVGFGLPPHPMRRRAP